MQHLQTENVTSILNTFDYEKFQSQLYQKINREMANDLCHSVKRSVIKALQQNEPGVLGDTGLENQWEEICVIVDDGDSDLYQDCIDTIDEMISLSIEEMNLTAWQKTAIWLCTSNGIDWVFDENDKVSGEVSSCWDDSDIVRRIRDEYVCPAAMDFTNERLEAYSESGYAMDEDYEIDEDCEDMDEESDEDPTDDGVANIDMQNTQPMSNTSTRPSSSSTAPEQDLENVTASAMALPEAPEIAKFWASPEGKAEIAKRKAGKAARMEQYKHQLPLKLGIRTPETDV